MKKRLLLLISRFRHLILYGIIGLCSSSFDFIIYSFLIGRTGMGYIMSNCVSVLGGITLSFLLNRNFNFKVKDKTRQRFIMFLTVGLCGLMLSNMILWVCVELLHVEKLLSKTLSIVMVVFLQFLLNKYLTFKPTKIKQS